jgi:hypothetical protein
MVPGEDSSSVVPPALSPFRIPSGKLPQTEFVANTTSTGGGAVNRLFAVILKNLSGRRLLIPAWPAF